MLQICAFLYTTGLLCLASFLGPSQLFKVVPKKDRRAYIAGDKATSYVILSNNSQMLLPAGCVLPCMALLGSLSPTAFSPLTRIS